MFSSRAANEVWGSSLHYTGVDVSIAMLETAEEIMDVMSLNGAHIPNVTLKPFTSYGTQATRHDIVVSAFTLSELTEPGLRKSTLEHLWESTNDMLVRQKSYSAWVLLMKAPNIVQLN